MLASLGQVLRSPSFPQQVGLDRTAAGLSLPTRIVGLEEYSRSVVELFRISALLVVDPLDG